MARDGVVDVGEVDLEVILGAASHGQFSGKAVARSR